MSLSVRANLSTQEIDGELVILDKINDQIHQLNPVASYIWQQIVSGLELNEILEQLINTYNVERSAAQTDLDKVIQQFKDLNLLT